MFDEECHLLGVHLFILRQKSGLVKQGLKFFLGVNVPKLGHKMGKQLKKKDEKDEIHRKGNHPFGQGCWRKNWWTG